jgi:TPR repeat protein
VPEFVEVALMRSVPEVAARLGAFPVTNDAAARLLVRLGVGVGVGVGEPDVAVPRFRAGGEPLRFADPDPGVARGADRAMHVALRYDETHELRAAGEVRRTLRAVLDRAGVRELYPTGGDVDRFDIDAYELDVDLVAIAEQAAAAVGPEPLDPRRAMSVHQALLAAYVLADDGFTHSTVVWPHLEVVGEAILSLECELLSAVVHAATKEPTAAASAAARRAGRRLLALGGDAVGDEVLVAYLASAVDRPDLEARWRHVEDGLGAPPPARVVAEKERRAELHDPGRFGAVALATRRVCQIRDATPWELGVEKAAVETADARGHLPFMSPGGEQDRLEAALADALTENEGVTVIVLRGPSGAGKSRMAFEAATAVAPDAWVIAPRTAAATAVVHDPREHPALAADPHRGVILWLDDVELHIGVDPDDADRPGLTVAHLERMRASGPARPIVVLATAGGKGYRTHREAGERVELQRLGLEIDRFIQSADVVIPVSGRVPRATVTAVLGAGAADEIAANGIGSYALRTEVLSSLYVRGDWPSHLEAPAGERREGLALADALLAWRIAVADEPVALDDAQRLWVQFRQVRDLHGPADEEAWQAALAWATATPVAHQPLVRAGGDGALDVNDHVRDVADVGAIADHLLRQQELLGHAVSDPFQVGLRLHLAAPDVALAFYRRAMEAGDERAPNNIGALISAERPDDAIVYFRRAVEQGDARGHLNLGVLLDERDPEEAQRQLRRAIAAGETAAYVLLATSIEAERPDEALALLREGAAAGDADAMFEYGKRLIRDDPPRGRQVLGLAIERGSPRAMTFVALSYLQEDRDKALELFERAGRLGDPMGYFGKANFLGQGSDADTEEIRRAQLDLYRAAADAGVAEAMFNVGVLVADQDPDESELYYERAVAEGHAGAMNNLGLRLRERDPRRAEELFRSAIAIGGDDVPESMSSLADLLVERDREEAMQLLRRAGELGDRRALFNLGGLLVATNRDEAIELLGRAVELGHEDAMVHLAHLQLEDEQENAVALLRRAAELGNANAQNYLATLLYERDEKEAGRWFQAAVENGSVDAMVNLGHRLFRTDPQQAVRLWRRAAASGSIEAAEALADVAGPDEAVEVPESTEMVNEAVRLLEQRPDHARRLMESAAELGNVTAVVNLAVLEMDRDPERARELLRMAAEAGSGRATLYLADVLAESDPAEAEALFRKAAACGEPGALTSLARHVEHSDPAEAHSIFERAADDGDPSAMLQLARILLGSDRPAAVAWLRQAAAAGSVDAMHNLGVLLWEEREREGLEWFQRASEAGSPGSSMNLGILLAGVNPEEALLYFQRAADLGDVGALEHIEALRSGDRSPER